MSKCLIILPDYINYSVEMPHCIAWVYYLLCRNASICCQSILSCWNASLYCQSIL